MKESWVKLTVRKMIRMDDMIRMPDLEGKEERMGGRRERRERENRLYLYRADRTSGKR